MSRNMGTPLVHCQHHLPRPQLLPPTPTGSTTTSVRIVMSSFAGNGEGYSSIAGHHSKLVRYSCSKYYFSIHDGRRRYASERSFHFTVSHWGDYLASLDASQWSPKRRQPFYELNGVAAAYSTASSAYPSSCGGALRAPLLDERNPSAPLG